MNGGGPDAAGGAAGSDDGAIFRAGPIPYRSMMPLSLVFTHPLPDGASVLSSGEVRAGARLDYSSIFISDVDGDETIFVDGEFSRTALAMRFGLGGRTEINVELPFLRYTSGFMDHFIEDFHTLFGTRQGKRDDFPSNEFGAEYATGDGVFFSADEDGIHLADVPVTLKVNVLDPAKDSLGLALRCLLELPTGNEHSGFGSGKLDGGAGVILEKRIEKLAIYFSMDQIFRRNPGFLDNVHIAHVTHGSLALEYPLGRNVSLVAQTDYQTKALEGVTLREFEDPQWMGGLGAAFRLKGGSVFRISIAEGFTKRSAPDFVISTGFSVAF